MAAPRPSARAQPSASAARAVLAAAEADADLADVTWSSFPDDGPGPDELPTMPLDDDPGPDDLLSADITAPRRIAHPLLSLYADDAGGVAWHADPPLAASGLGRERNRHLRRVEGLGIVLSQLADFVTAPDRWRAVMALAGMTKTELADRIATELDDSPNAVKTWLSQLEHSPSRFVQLPCGSFPLSWVNALGSRGTQTPAVRAHLAYADLLAGDPGLVRAGLPLSGSAPLRAAACPDGNGVDALRKSHPVLAACLLKPYVIWSLRARLPVFDLPGACVALGVPHGRGGYVVVMAVAGAFDGALRVVASYHADGEDPTRGELT